MKDYSDAMIDVETLGTDPDCVVLSVGIVFFNINEEDNYETLDDPKRSVYFALNPQEQIDMGRSVTFQTIDWWQEQDVMARKVFKECLKLDKADADNSDILRRIMHTLGECKDICLWGNGSGFDNPIWNSLLKTYQIKNPFKFWNDNDLRTAKRIAGNPKLQITRGVYHNALDDAKYQVLALQEYLRRINETGE